MSVKLDKDRVALRKKWMAEELEEFIESKNIYDRVDVAIREKIDESMQRIKEK